MPTRRLEDGRQRTWWWMDNRVVDEQWIAYVGVYAWAVFTVLVRHADDVGKTFPSARQIADITGISLSEVRRSLKMLLASGLVKRAKKGSPTSPSIYQIRSTPPSKNLKGAKPVAPQPKPKTPAVAREDATRSFLESLDEITDAVEEVFQESEPEPERTPKLKTPKLKRAASRRCPEDWQPNERHRELAAAEGVDFDRELAVFRDHTFSTSRSDWDATFRNWLRNAREHSRGYYRTTGGGWTEKSAKDEVEGFYRTEELV